MPWRERSIMDKKMEFITRLLDEERMTDLCREFGISRTTGYKLYKKYLLFGPKGLNDLRKAENKLSQ